MDDTRWEDARRIENWAGEVRVNVIRMVSLVAFYAYHLLNVLIFSRDDVTLRGAFYGRVTAICLLWALAGLVLYICLYRRRVAPWLSYISAGWDVLLLTALLALIGDGPKSGLVLLYFVLIAASALRLSLGVVYMTTVASAAGYLLIAAHYAWYVIGVERYHADKSLQVPRGQILLCLFLLTVAGLLAGQMVRQAQRLVAGYPVKVAEALEK